MTILMASGDTVSATRADLPYFTALSSKLTIARRNPPGWQSRITGSAGAILVAIPASAISSTIAVSRAVRSMRRIGPACRHCDGAMYLVSRYGIPQRDAGMRHIFRLVRASCRNIGSFYSGTDSLWM